MDEPNPFASPQAPPMPGERYSDVEVPPRILEYMQQTRPWVTFLSVMGFLTTLVAAGAILFMWTGTFRMGVGMGVEFIALVVSSIFVYFVPSILLWRYSQNLRIFLDYGGIDRLGDALQAQKSFWKYVGILVAIFITIYVIILLFGLALVVR